MVKFILNKKSFMKFGKWSLALFSLVLLGFFVVQYIIPILALGSPTLNDDVNVSLVSPGNNTYSTGANFTYNVSYTSAFENITNCTLWGNFTGSFAGNVSNTSIITNNAFNVLNATEVTDGSYEWNVYCYNTTDHGNYSSANYTVTVDLTNPKLNDTHPANSGYMDTANVVFNATLEETNINYNVNATVYYRKQGADIWQSQLLQCWNSAPSFTCNYTAINLANPPVSLADGETLQFFFNTTDLSGRTTSNGTSASPLTAILDTVDPTSPGTVYHVGNAPSETFENSTTIVFNWTAATDTISGIKRYLIYVNENGGGYSYNGTNSTPLGYQFTVGGGNTYLVRVTSEDNAGNENTTGTISNVTVTVDTTDPTSPTNVVFESDPTTIYDNDVTLVVNWTAATDTNGILQYKIHVSENGTAYPYNGTNTTPLGYQFTGADGNYYSVNVTAVDNAGNENTTGGNTTTTIWIDTSVPTSPTNVVFESDPTTSYGDDTTIVLNWTAATDVTSGIFNYKIYISENSAAYPYNGTNTTPLGYQFTGAEDNTYVVNVTAVDNATNENTTGATTSTTLTIDLTDPTSPSGVTFQADPSTSYDDDTTIVANWTAASDTHGIIEYRIYVSENSANAYLYNGTNTTPLGYQFTGADGNYYFVNVTANDTSHHLNTTGAVSSTNITVDTTAPTTILNASPTVANDSYTTNNYVYINVTFTETYADTCLLEFNNGTASNYTMSRSGSDYCYVNMTSQPDGEWSYNIFVNDSANNWGNNGTYNVTIDTVNPIINETVPTTGSYLSNPSSVRFQALLTEQNRHDSINVTVNWRREGVGNYQSNTTLCYGSAPSWTCNISGVSTGLLNTEVLQYFFNTSDMATRTNTTTVFTATIDTSVPTYTNNDDNATTIGVGDGVLIYANWTDTYTLGHAWLWTNETGNSAGMNWTSGSYGPIDINLSAGQTWSNFTWSNASVVASTIIGWKIYANDTAGNENVTVEGTFSIDNTVPTWTQNESSVANTSTIVKGTSVEIRALWSDDSALHQYWIYNNKTNTNASHASFGAGNWSNLTVATSSFTVGDVFYALIYANDTAGNENFTVRYLYTIDGTPPMPGNQSDTVAGAAVFTPGASYTLNITWIDDLGYNNVSVVLLNFSSLSTNQTGTSLGSNNYSYTLTGLGVGNYSYVWYANDTSDNWNLTDTYHLNITRNTTNPINIWLVNSSDTYNNTNLTESAGISITINATSLFVNETEVKLYSNVSGAEAQITNPYTSSALSAGTYTLKANITQTNYTSNETLTFYLTVTADTTAPTVWLYDYTNGTAKKSGSELTLNISVSDGTGITPGDSCNVTFVNTGVTNRTITYSNGWCNGTVLVPTTGVGADGNFTINITVNDNSTNRNEGYNNTYFVAIDNTTPIVTMTFPISGTYNKSDSSHFIWINGTVSDNMVMGSGNVTTNSTYFNNNVVTFSGANNSAFGFRNTSVIPDGYYAIKINYTDEATNTGEATVYFYVDNNPPSAAIALKNSTAGAYQPTSVQTIEVYVADVQKTNDTITLNYTNYATGSPVWTAISLSGTPGTGTTYTGTIDIRHLTLETDYTIQYYITGSDNATNSITAAVGGSSTLGSTLSNITVDKWCGNNGTALSYCSYSEGWSGLSTGATNKYHEVHWATYQLSGASSLSNNYTIDNVLSSINGKYSYVYHRNISSSATPWLSYDPNIAWNLNTLRYANNTDTQYFVNVTTANAVIRIA